MEDNQGNIREKSGNFPTIRNDKDGLVVDMKIRGCSNKKISEATGISLKTVQNIVSKGGRLYSAIQSLREDKTITLAENNLTVWDSLLAAKDPAVQELKRIALESPNDVARLKAIDMIIGLIGIRDDDKPPFLDPHNMNDSLERLAKWINQKVLRTFQREPQSWFLNLVKV